MQNASPPIKWLTPYMILLSDRRFRNYEFSASDLGCVFDGVIDWCNFRDLVADEHKEAVRQMQSWESSFYAIDKPLRDGDCFIFSVYPTPLFETAYAGAKLGLWWNGEEQRCDITTTVKNIVSDLTKPVSKNQLTGLEENLAAWEVHFPHAPETKIFRDALAAFKASTIICPKHIWWLNLDDGLKEWRDLLDSDHEAMIDGFRNLMLMFISDWKEKFPGDERVIDFEVDFTLDMISRRRIVGMNGVEYERV